MSNEQMRPASKEKAPDPSNTYERAHPENESGAGRMDNNKAVPTPRADSMKTSAPNKQDPTRQLNAEDVIDQRSTARAGSAKQAVRQHDQTQPDQSMKGE